MRRTATTLIASAATAAALIGWVPAAAAATPVGPTGAGGFSLVAADLGGLWRAPTEAEVLGFSPVLGPAPSLPADGRAFAQSLDEALAAPSTWSQSLSSGSAASHSFSGTASASPVGAAAAARASVSVLSVLSVPEPDALGLLLCGLVGLLGLAVRARVLAPSKRR